MRSATRVGVAVLAAVTTSALAGALVLGGGLTGRDTAGAATGPALSVDPTADRHPISPYIYGMNFADEALARELSLPVRRWGGNATTRYHYLYDTTNRASDWFFENIAEDNSNPAALPDGSSTDETIEQDRRTGSATIITVPLIGWAPKARDGSCGFSVAKYGPQQSTDQFRPDCGNGKRPDGTNITGNDPHDTSVEIGPQYIRDWLGHLTGKYGTAANGGVRFYNLDNEPDLWFSTHRDVHPEGASSVELRDKTYAIAAAVKAADPTAATLGPVGWGWTSWDFSGLDQEVCGRTNCWSNPPDAAARGGLPFTTWYLQQMRAYEQQNGTRILDYFDMHFYPQGSGVAFGNGNDPNTNALRLRSTRALWDPTYTDESWINTQVRLIPRMKDTVAANYPGTKTAITEYNWGALDHINGALTQADVLGIFGREGLDLATIWSPPTSNQPGAYAFRMYRNYDGAGGRFGETSVRATSADQGKLAVYAAERTDGALTIMVVNKAGEELTSSMDIRGTANGRAQVYRYSSANLSAIAHLPDATTTPTSGGASLSYTYPADSITLFVVPRSDQTSAPPTTTTRPPTTTTRPPTTTTTRPPTTTTRPPTTTTRPPTTTTRPPTTTTTRPPTTTQPGTRTCTAAYSVVNQWPGGFQAEVRVTAGSSAIAGWTVTMVFANGQTVTQIWNATASTSGATVTARNMSYNGSLAAGAGTTFGFLGSWNGTNSAPTPSCTAT